VTGNGKYVNCLVNLHNRRASVKPSRERSTAIVETRRSSFDCCVSVLARRINNVNDSGKFRELTRRMHNIRQTVGSRGKALVWEQSPPESKVLRK